MDNQILFVFEGEVTEAGIVTKLIEYHLNENTVIHCAFCQDIYQLHKVLMDDEDLDLFMILKDLPSNEDQLSKFNRTDFAEIYLFFDYDGHATKADDIKLKELLHTFDNETESGKLYISYPMVEAVRHLHPDVNFETVQVPAKEVIGYKKMVGDQGAHIYQNLKACKEKIWLIIIDQHLRKMNFIVNDVFEIPNELISQSTIFENQLEKYIRNLELVAVLSAFPPFLLDYYGCKQLKENLFPKSEIE